MRILIKATAVSLAWVEVHHGSLGQDGRRSQGYYMRIVVFELVVCTHSTISISFVNSAISFSNLCLSSSNYYRTSTSSEASSSKPFNVMLHSNKSRFAFSKRSCKNACKNSLTYISLIWCYLVHMKISHCVSLSIFAISEDSFPNTFRYSL